MKELSVEEKKITERTRNMYTLTFQVQSTMGHQTLSWARIKGLV